jgi:hypothetical protein
VDRARLAQVVLLAVPIAVIGIRGAAAHAATFTVEPAEVDAGDTITFSFTTEAGDWPAGYDGAEQPTSLYFNGPCTNSIFFNFFNQYGIDSQIAFPGPGWQNFPVECRTLRNPGAYVASFQYNRLDASGLAVSHRIDVPFVVHALLALRAIPASIAVGDTTLLEVTGFDPGEQTTDMFVLCADDGTDTAVSPTSIGEGFAVSWPGPFWSGTCDSTVPGRYSAAVATTRQTASADFLVFGDLDGDGWPDGDDNCPTVSNPGQENADGDDLGDACDRDNDGDGRVDDEDNCPAVPNPPWHDHDDDGLGDECDPDADADGIPNGSDNCPRHPNPGQEDDDVDGFGDPCDPDPGDSDNDGVGDLADNCPNVFNPAQQDMDGDSVGSACDPDIDGDGVSNAEETAAGTDPVGAEPIAPGINGFDAAGGAIAAGTSLPLGEPIGVVIDPVGDAETIEVTVSDPWGGAYVEDTLVPQSPVAFRFVPVFPGDWTVAATPAGGETFLATFSVPESDPTPLGVGAAVAVAAVRRARRRAG